MDFGSFYHHRLRIQRDRFLSLEHTLLGSGGYFKALSQGAPVTLPDEFHIEDHRNFDPGRA